MMWHEAHLFWNTLPADLIAEGFCPVTVGEVVIAASTATDHNTGIESVLIIIFSSARGCATRGVSLPLQPAPMRNASVPYPGDVMEKADRNCSSCSPRFTHQEIAEILGKPRMPPPGPPTSVRRQGNRKPSTRKSSTAAEWSYPLRKATRATTVPTARRRPS